MAYCAWRETRMASASLLEAGRGRHRIRVGSRHLPRQSCARRSSPSPTTCGGLRREARRPVRTAPLSIPLPGAAAPPVAALLRALRSHEELRAGFRHHEILPGRAPRFAAPPASYAALAPALARRGVGALFEHQARALERLE